MSHKVWLYLSDPLLFPGAIHFDLLVSQAGPKHAKDFNAGALSSGNVGVSAADGAVSPDVAPQTSSSRTPQKMGRHSSNGQDSSVVGQLR